MGWIIILGEGIGLLGEQETPFGAKSSTEIRTFAAMTESRHYPAKLLLFGEHILLLGAAALAVPVPAFGGRWARHAPVAEARRGQLLAFAEALKALPGLDAAAFEAEVYDGLYFASNIPVGYGLGSSGALSAGVYDRFARVKTADLAELKQLFAQMESHFHGRSSGIDPLTSYLAQPLLIRRQQEVSVASPQNWLAGTAPQVFLLDSRQPRKTGPLVQWFLEKSAEQTFARLLETELLPAHEAMLAAWQEARADVFWENIRRVSAFQWQHMPPMIPAGLRDIWAEALENEPFVLKICGAGGGGYVLGFAQNKAAAQYWAGKVGFSIVFPFDPAPTDVQQA